MRVVPVAQAVQCRPRWKVSATIRAPTLWSRPAPMIRGHTLIEDVLLAPRLTAVPSHFALFALAGAGHRG